MEGEIIVVDNNSTDRSRAYFSDKFYNVKFIWNETNEGFSRANNRALKIASGDYILFLNPDTLVPEDCFEKCISFIRGHNDAIALGIKMIDGSGKFLKESKRGFPSPTTSLYKLSGLSNLFPNSKVFSKYHLGHFDKNENHQVDVLAGAFIMLPKIIIEKTGGFDERFFMYGEDIDLSYRIQKAGYKNFYFADSCIVHFKGESTKKGSLDYVKMFYKAMSLFVQKHYGGSRGPLYNSVIQAAIFLRGAMAGFGRLTRGNGVNSGKTAPGKNERNPIAIVGTEQQFQEVLTLLTTTNKQERLVARIRIEETNEEENEEDTIGPVDDLKILLKKYGLKEIIFCEEILGYKNIIESISQVSGRAHFKIFNSSTKTLIGSDRKNSSAAILAGKSVSV